MICILFVLNRAISKLSIGPVYFLELIIFISLYKKIKVIAKLSKELYFGSALFLFGVGWLVYELLTGQFETLNIRRFALALYMVVPMIIIVYGREITQMLMKNSYLLFAAILIANTVHLPNFQTSLSCQVLGLMLIAILFHPQTERIRNSLPGLCFVVGVYLIIILGLNGDGLYKTPLLGLVLSLVAITVHRYFRFITGAEKIGHSFNIQTLTAIALAGIAIAAVPLAQSVLAEALYAMSGLTGVKEFSDFASSIASEQSRGRGSSSDTADTRTMFWMGVIEHSKTSLNYLLVGNGHYMSFFDKIFVDSSFIRSHLLEPHNSFLGIYYRYGLAGLSLFVAYLFQIRFFLAKIYIPNKSMLIACTIIAIVYAMFEVALESPHGAIIFWIIWLFPYLAGTLRAEVATTPIESRLNENSDSAQ